MSQEHFTITTTEQVSNFLLMSSQANPAAAADSTAVPNSNVQLVPPSPAPPLPPVPYSPASHIISQQAPSNPAGGHPYPLQSLQEAINMQSVQQAVQIALASGAFKLQLSASPHLEQHEESPQSFCVDSNQAKELAQSRQLQTSIPTTTQGIFKTPATLQLRQTTKVPDVLPPQPPQPPQPSTSKGYKTQSKMPQGQKQVSPGEAKLLQPTLHGVSGPLVCLPTPWEMHFTMLCVNSDGEWVYYNNLTLNLPLSECPSLALRLHEVLMILSLEGPKAEYRKHISETYKESYFCSEICDGRFQVNWLVDSRTETGVDRPVFSHTLKSCDEISKLCKVLKELAPLMINQGESFVSVCNDLSDYICKELKEDCVDILEQLIVAKESSNLSPVRELMEQFYSKQGDRFCAKHQRLFICNYSYFLYILGLTVIAHSCQ